MLCFKVSVSLCSLGLDLNEPASLHGVLKAFWSEILGEERKDLDSKNHRIYMQTEVLAAEVLFCDFGLVAFATDLRKDVEEWGVPIIKDSPWPPPEVLKTFPESRAGNGYHIDTL